MVWYGMIWYRMLLLLNTHLQAFGDVGQPVQDWNEPEVCGRRHLQALSNGQQVLELCVVHLESSALRLLQVRAARARCATTRRRLEGNGGVTCQGGTQAETDRYSVYSLG